MNLQNDILPLLGQHVGLTSGQRGVVYPLYVRPTYQQKLPGGVRIGSLFAIGNVDSHPGDRFVIARTDSWISTDGVRVAVTQIIGAWLGSYLRYDNIFFAQDKHPKFIGDQYINQRAYWLIGKAKDIFHRAKEYR